MTGLKLPKKAQEVIEKLKKAGFEAFAVGGGVRDLIMNRPTENWDFTTNATPAQILKVFPNGFYDNRFGTVGVAKEGEVFEITTYRTEWGYSDRRHPDKIKWGETLDQDLSRRDFTIDAIAFDGKKLVDKFGGRDDIKRRLVKTVGDPNKRFSEDALRLLRAVRIATQLAFIIDHDTFLAIKKNSPLIKKISGERIRDEVLKILETDFPADGFYLLRNSGLLEQILPEIEACFGVPQQSPKRHHLYDVGTHLFLSLRNCPKKDPIVRFATLLHDVGKPATFKKDSQGIITFYNHEVIGASIAKNIGQRLRLSKKDLQKLVTLVRWHQFSVDERQTDAAIRRFIKRVGKENLSDILAVRIGDRLGGGAKETSWRLEKFKKRLNEVQKQPFSVTDLKVDGHDVMKILKIGQGPLVGKLLNILFQEVVEDKEKNKREYLLKRIKTIGKNLSNLE